MTEDGTQIIQDGTPVADDTQAAEQDQERYPLREARDDPRWAVRIVWTWVIVALFLLLFLVTLLILGYWYD